MNKAMMMAMLMGASGLFATAAQAADCASCAGCIAAAAKAKAAAKVKAQTKCPVMGGKINKNLYVDQAGKRIYVCCKGCIAPIQKDFAKHAKKVEAAGETLAKVQTTCPVMGGKINKKQYVDVKGKRIYVCCPGCIGTIKADPDKYIQKLEKEGITLDAAPKSDTRKSKT